jgi:signal transduction histidine kinase
MILDLTALTLLVYYTGGIESPLFLLFVFHMVIGSLILPKNVIYFAAGLVILIFSLLVFGEYFNAIPHHPISGFLVSPYYNNFSFISVFLIVYGFVLGVTVLLTNRIARELYKMEENMLDSLDKIKATEIEKENYITGVVHEIKTPISAVQSYLDLILQKYLGPLDSKIEEKLIRTRTRSDEAIQMINNILKISRLKLLDDLGKEELDINALICSALEKLNMHMEAKDINCTLNDNTKNKNKVAGDKFLMEIGFSNIISNAVKYCDKGGKLLISIKELGSGIEISFCDNGVGIPKEEIDNIFKEFYRGSNIKHKGYEGVGLGLSVVNQIINRHGGTIRVESPSRMADDTHPGTCFIIYLPVI